MLHHEHKRRVLEKLRTARNEREEALNMSAPATSHEPEVIPDVLRKELSVMLDDLNWILPQLEPTQ
jgi:hypothetical protein